MILSLSARYLRIFIAKCFWATLSYVCAIAFLEGQKWSKQIVPQKNDLGIKTWQKEDNDKKQALNHLNSNKIEQFHNFRYKSMGIYNQR